MDYLHADMADDIRETGVTVAVKCDLPLPVTPSAAVPSPLFFGPGHVTMKTTVKYTTIFVVISFFVCLLFMPIATGLLGGV